MKSAFVLKAETGVKSAQMLLEAGDTDGACSRAYYAMFDAARAALAWAGIAPERGAFRTHHGLTAAFAQHMVKPGLFPAEPGRAIQRAQAVRLIADYDASPVPAAEAAETVRAAQRFVETAAALVAQPYPPPVAPSP